MRVPLAHGVRKVRAAQKVLPCHVLKSVSSHGQRDFGSCLVYLSEPLVAARCAKESIDSTQNGLERKQHTFHIDASHAPRVLSLTVAALITRLFSTGFVDDSNAFRARPKLLGNARTEKYYATSADSTRNCCRTGFGGHEAAAKGQCASQLLQIEITRHLENVRCVFNNRIQHGLIGLRT